MSQCVRARACEFETQKQQHGSKGRIQTFDCTRLSRLSYQSQKQEQLVARYRVSRRPSRTVAAAAAADRFFIIEMEIEVKEK